MTDNVDVNVGGHRVVADARRQAVDALRGYAYQIYVSTIAWMELGENDVLALEVAEDYARLSSGQIDAVQVKDTAISGSFTSNSKGFAEAIESFVNLVEANPSKAIKFRFLTTSPIGTEKKLSDRVSDHPAIDYWRMAARTADVAPLRKRLKALTLSERVIKFLENRSDDELRTDLLQRVHWDCGEQAIDGVRHEIEQKAIIIGERQHVSPSNSKQVVPALIDRLLTAIIQDENRALTRADMLETFERASHASVPKRLLEQHIELMNAAAPILGGGAAIHQQLQSPEPVFLRDFPQLRELVVRGELKAVSAQAIAEMGVAWLVAASGFGKTILARDIAKDAGGEWLMVGLRNLKPEAVSARLTVLLGELGKQNIRGVILDDFDPSREAEQAFLRLIAASKRRDILIIVTSHKKIAPAVAEYIGIGAADSISVGSFNEKEVHMLVELLGGDPDAWAKYVRAASAGGHPQLAMAVARGLKDKHWQPSSLERIENLLGNDENAVALRDQAKRRLIEDLNPESRGLLARVSVAFAPISRSTIFKLANIDPSLADPAALTETLVDRWVEREDGERFRHSPLVRGLSKEFLQEDEIIRCHQVLAKEMLGGETWDASVVNGAFLHALAGKEEQSLTRVAISILQAPNNSLPNLSNELISLKYLAMDKAPYRPNSHISCLLRIAQLILVLHDDNRRASDVWTVVLSELNNFDDIDLAKTTKLLALSKMLIFKSVVGDIPNVPKLIVDLSNAAEADETLLDPNSLIEGVGAHDRPVSLVEFAFVVQAMGISSVSEFKRFLDDLDQLDNGRRKQLLGGVSSGFYSVSLFFNSPWINEERRDELDPKQAIGLYEQIESLFSKWEMRDLAGGAAAAAIALLDEYLNDADAALAKAENAINTYGDVRVLLRAKARVYYRSKRYGEHLLAAEPLLESLSSDDLVDQMYLYRELGISAFEDGDYAKAGSLFFRGYEAGATVESEERSLETNLMMFGLLADAGVANTKNGWFVEGIKQLSEALKLTWDIKAESSYRAYAFKRLLGHAILWANSEATNHEVEIDNQPAQVVAGCVSNPSPAKGMDELPTGLPDYQWYLLASADIWQGETLGVDAEIDTFVRNVDGPILTSEITLWIDRMEAAASRRDVQSFVSALPYCVSGHLKFQKDAAAWRAQDINDPQRGELTLASPADIEAGLDSVVGSLATLFASALADGDFNIVNEFESALAGQQELIGSKLLDAAKGKSAKPPTLASEVVRCGAAALRAGTSPVDLKQLYLCCFRLFQGVQKQGRSSKSGGVEKLSQWIKQQWQDVIDNRRFLLSNPSINVPEIESALSISNSPSSIATLLIALQPALKFQLDDENATFLREAAQPNLGY